MEDPEAEIANLKAQIASTRERRIAAQKDVAALPALRRSLERTERDVSSGATSEVEELRKRSGELRDEIIDCAYSIDYIGIRVDSISFQHKSGPEYARLQEVFAADSKQRRAMREDPRLEEFALTLPHSESADN